MTENSEPTPAAQTEKKSQKKIPNFYRDMIASLLVMYSSSQEAVRYIIAQDIHGYVLALMQYTDKLAEVLDEKTYGELLLESKNNLTSAINYMKLNETSEGQRLLGESMEILKKLIIQNHIVVDGFVQMNNPLASASLGAAPESTNFKPIGGI